MMKSESKGGKTAKALVLSGLVCPGVGQLTLGRKKRAIALIAASLLIVIAIMIKIFFITQQVMLTPDVMMGFSLESFYSSFITIRHRVYHETVPYLLTFLGIWLAGIIDILIPQDR